MTGHIIQSSLGSVRALSANTRRTSLVPITALVAVASLLTSLCQPSLGAQINYGDFAGTHVDYVDVTEDSGADEALPLFGMPTVTGNSIDFNPVGFDASSMNGGADITDSNLVFMIVAKTGSRIQSVQFSEAGDTTMAGNVPVNSTGTATSVTATGVLDIHEVDFNPINHISVPFSLTFSPSGGTYFLGTDGAGGPLYHSQWSGSGTVNVEAILQANNVPFITGATKVSIDLDNTLAAVSQLGTSAHIAKKDFGGISIRVPGFGGEGEPEIPEPVSFVLAGLGITSLTLLRRSR